MQLIPSFDPTMNGATPGANGVIQVGAADAGSKMLLYNESQVNLALDFYNGNQGMLHAWEARYWTLDGDTRQVGWTIESVLNQPSPPISAVKGELYGPQEKIEGTYPISLVRQTSTSGTVTTVGSTLSNEGTGAGNEIVDIGTTANAKLWDVFNDHFTISIEIAGVKHTILQGSLSGNPAKIGQAGDTTEILGSLQVDQSLALNTPVTDIAGDTSGTAHCYEDMRGSIKRVVIILDNYKHVGAAQPQFVLPVPFLKGATIRAGNINTNVACWQGGAAQNINVVTAEGAFTPNPSIGPFLWGEVTAAFDRVLLPDLMGSTAGRAMIEIVGN